VELNDHIKNLDIEDDLLLRKVKENSYLLICDNFENTEKIINYSCPYFKLRYLKNSPDDIRSFILINRDLIKEKFVKTLPNANVKAMKRIINSHLFSNQKYNV